MSDPLIHIIDDDASLSTALARLFRSVGIEAVTYGSASAFRDADLPERPGCVVLDVRLPGQSGLDLQADMARSDGALPVILMTGHGDIPMSVRAMKAGAVDFLTKPFRDQDMLDAALSAIEADRSRRKARDEVREIRDRYAALSPRERQVLALVACGQMNKQIAGHLGLSEITVKVHRRAVMDKLQARSAAELVLMAERLGVRADQSDLHDPA
jgi:FixJ family two-component response regulator